MFDLKILCLQKAENSAVIFLDVENLRLVVFIFVGFCRLGAIRCKFKTNVCEKKLLI